MESDLVRHPQSSNYSHAAANRSQGVSMVPSCGPTDINFGSPTAANLASRGDQPPFLPSISTWDIFTKLPIGGVAFTETATEATYISTLDSGKICELDPRKGLTGKLAVSQDGKSVTFLEKGYILIEIEPQSYELKNTKYATWRAKVNRTPVHLGSVLLNNRNEIQNSNWDEMSSVVTYNASYNFYFGQLNGLIRALPAKAETYGGGDKYEQVDFSWGLPLKFSRYTITLAQKLRHRFLKALKSLGY